MSGKNPKICVAILWHQHQPYYRELSSHELVMPWVRLHSVKDYHDMAARLERFPETHVTINLVPSLLKQIESYVNGEVTDLHLNLSNLRADYLSTEQKRRILERLFDAGEDHLIHPFPRYRELKELRDGMGIDRAASMFQAHDFRDIQVLFNLVWVDPMIRKADPFLVDLQRKGQGYSEGEKDQLLKRHIEIMAEVIPLHRRLQEKGIIEVSTTPFYHPILPLLCDTNEAKVALPSINLPANRFRHPVDARKQVSMAVGYYEEKLGRKPRGMWPSEGSVSPEAAEIIASEKIRWIASDEEVLGVSLGKPVKRSSKGVIQSPEILYRVYEYQTPSGPLNMIFRDHAISDMIGFHYSRWPSDAAARDLISRLEQIAEGVVENGEAPFIVPIILDGENCWEFYPEDGGPFLDDLYERLAEHKDIRAVTVSEYLDEYGSCKGAIQPLPKLHSGSWINHNFRVWIGHAEDNLSWDLLSETRQALVRAEERGQLSGEVLQKAWEEIHVAEGSDWNWWYGDEHHTPFWDTFDSLYRKHLQNVYEFIGQTPPGSLLRPISRKEEIKLVQQPVQTITPVIDGRTTRYFDWYGAGRFEPAGAGGAMHGKESRVQALFFGFDLKNFYIRLDFRMPEGPPREGESVGVYFLPPISVRVTCAMGPSGIEGRMERQVHENWEPIHAECVPALGSVFEAAIPWSGLAGVQEGKEFEFVVSLNKGDREIERIPSRSTLSTICPGEDFDDTMWSV